MTTSQRRDGAGTDSDDGPAAKSPSAAALALLPLLALVPLLFVIGRPVMIDDTLYLKVAEQILRDPLRPLDAMTYWSSQSRPLWDVLKNPPGVSYWLAAAKALGAQSETALHLSLLPFAAAAALAGHRLARRFAGESPWLTALWVASPAFLVSASTLMADVPAMALALWGLALWIDGVDGERRRACLAGAFLAGLAVLVKYTAVLGLAILAIYLVLRTSPARWAAGLGRLWPALVPSAVWSGWNLLQWGSLHQVDSLGVLAEGGSRFPWGLLQGGISTGTFAVGSAVFPLLFVVPTLRGLGRLPLAATAAGIGGGAAWATTRIWPEQPTWTAIVAGLLVAVAVCATLAVVRGTSTVDGAGRRDGLFLALWAAVYAVFVAMVSWAVAARFIVPLLPPLALLLARALGARPGQTLAPGSRRLLGLTTVGVLALSTLVLRADELPGQFHREAIASVAARAKTEGRRVYFLGSWGFLHYAEQLGMQWLDLARDDARAGDFLIRGRYVSHSRISTALEKRLEPLGELVGPVPPLGVHTMNPRAGGGFHSSVYGPLPFTLSRDPAAVVVVYRLRDH